MSEFPITTCKVTLRHIHKFSVFNLVCFYTLWDLIYFLSKWLLFWITAVFQLKSAILLMKNQGIHLGSKLRIEMFIRCC